MRRAVRRLLVALAVLLLVALAGLAWAAVRALSTEATVRDTAALAPADVERALRLARQHDPRQAIPGVQRTLSLFYKPYTRTQSETAIRAKHSEILQSSWLKDKLGRVETLGNLPVFATGSAAVYFEQRPQDVRGRVLERQAPERTLEVVVDEGVADRLPGFDRIEERPAGSVRARLRRREEAGPRGLVAEQGHQRRGVRLRQASPRRRIRRSSNSRRT